MSTKTNLKSDEQLLIQGIDNMTCGFLCISGIAKETDGSKERTKTSHLSSKIQKDFTGQTQCKV